MDKARQTMCWSLAAQAGAEQRADAMLWADALLEELQARSTVPWQSSLPLPSPSSAAGHASPKRLQGQLPLRTSSSGGTHDAADCSAWCDLVHTRAASAL